MSFLRRVRTHLAGQQGFTLPELLVTMVVGTVILLGAFAIIDASVTQSARTQDQVDTIARGRQAMETITQELRAQVCLGSGAGQAAVTAGDANSVEFYADLGDNNSRPSPGTDVFRPDRFRLTYDPVARKIVEQVYEGSSSPAPPNQTFTLRRTRTLLENVDLITGKPFLRYYAFTGTEPIAPSRQLPVPLNSDDRARVVQIAVSYVARPTSGSLSGRRATWFENFVYVRTSDPSDPTRSPLCV